ncbi:MAG: gamma-glutamyl-gamma-aminobutyrate hydrolase family protein [Gemmatimonadetes bacterium]|nr:gamma-glutamyl-gamma-aminobutyrate hydrolase family protein [Gemmatimonadota bacterium]
MSASLVALTTAIEPQSGPYSQPRVSIYAAYIDALQLNGLAPVLLTPGHSLAAIEALMDHCDGLVLSGGGDVDPARYGERPAPLLDAVSHARDAMEFGALELALGRGIPVLGICRGCQVMNVHLGGTLFQDIDTERPGSVGHRQTGAWHERSHDVTVEPGSRLHEAVGVGEFHVNTFHHQAIRDVAPHTRIVATAEDGLVEAIELRDHRWAVGVQWHPERREASAPDGDPDRRLFAAFAGAVLALAVPRR